MLFEGLLEVVKVSHVGDLDPKVINNETKCDGAPYVPPEARGVLALVVSFDGMVCLKELISEYPSLGEAVHSFADFHVDPSIGGDKIMQVVHRRNLVWDDANVKGKLHVLVRGHWRVEGEISQVNLKEDCPQCAVGGRVDEELCSGEIGSRSCQVAQVVNAPPPKCQTSTVLFLLFWAKIAADLTICGLFCGWYLVFVDEKTSVSALLILDALEESSQFVGKACFPPSFGCRILDEMAVLKDVAHCIINDGADEVVRAQFGKGDLISHQNVANCFGCGGDVGLRRGHGLCHENAIKHVSHTCPQVAPCEWTMGG
jgi:hypothetical protein